MGKSVPIEMWTLVCGVFTAAGGASDGLKAVKVKHTPIALLAVIMCPRRLALLQAYALTTPHLGTHKLTILAKKDANLKKDISSWIKIIKTGEARRQQSDARSKELHNGRTKREHEHDSCMQNFGQTRNERKSELCLQNFG
jgi:hypothetical protein